MAYAMYLRKSRIDEEAVLENTHTPHTYEPQPVGLAIKVIKDIKTGNLQGKRVPLFRITPSAATLFESTC